MSAEVTSILRHNGSFKDYLLGLDFIRKMIVDQEDELKRGLMDFYKSSDNDESNFQRYLCLISTNLTTVLATIQSKSLKINSEKSLLETINRFAKANHQNGVENCLLIIESLTDFHENLKYTEEILQIVIDNFEKRILSKLKLLSPKDYCDGRKSTDQTNNYHANIADYENAINQIILKCRLLIVSSKENVTTGLLTSSALSERLLSNCDVDTVPLLSIIPDLTAKMEDIFRFGKLWLDKEEIFLYQIRQEIRDIKLQTKEKFTKIADVKQNHSRLLKAMRASYLMCQNNKHKMTDIKKQLNGLSEQILESKKEYEKKVSQKENTENMVEFLEISISQTRRNYGLQLKRLKMKKEVKDIEQSISTSQIAIVELTNKINAISQAAETVEKKSEKDSNDLSKTKSDLESYSKDVLILKSDLKNLKNLLSTFESFETLRTSPEFVENILDQQATDLVKLAPSLMEKINMKKNVPS